MTDDICSALLCHPELQRNNKTVGNVFFFSPLHLRPWHMSNCFFFFFYVFAMLLFLDFFSYDKMLSYFFKQDCISRAGLIVSRQHFPCRVFKSFLK